ncbi:MAG: hypothetical protein CM1200mP10_22170 [Candidatus Neomarinimicrobiota bacterium]|nr:MAG: hypothetical protein CM1200mP10_22170 [Candidatus Neomarinimicrobiota bacterium]
MKEIDDINNSLNALTRAKDLLKRKLSKVDPESMSFAKIGICTDFLTRFY